MNAEMFEIPAPILNHVSFSDLDLINDTISVVFSFAPDLGGSPIGEVDIGPQSPLFEPLDTYYKLVCRELFPGSERWHGNWPMMLAHIDIDSLLSEPLTVELETKWFIDRDDIERLLAIFENLNLAKDCGLTIEFICGCDDEVAFGEDMLSRWAAAVYPLNLEVTRCYPFNFRFELCANPGEFDQPSHEYLTAIGS